MLHIECYNTSINICTAHSTRSTHNDAREALCYAQIAYRCCCDYACLLCVYIGGTRPESLSHTAASTNVNTSTTAATSSQSLALFFKSVVISIVAAVKEALRHLIACIPDDLDLEHRYDKLCT
jgi:hypothetical protein